jgi:hypothetical protein
MHVHLNFDTSGPSFTWLTVELNGAVAGKLQTTTANAKDLLLILCCGCGEHDKIESSGILYPGIGTPLPVAVRK